MKLLLRLLLSGMPIVAVVLVIMQVVFSNELATLGKQLGKLDSEVTLEKDMHEALATEVASVSSLVSLRVRASELGFKAPTRDQIIALTPEVPVAFGVAHNTAYPPLQ